MNAAVTLPPVPAGLVCSTRNFLTPPIVFGPRTLPDRVLFAALTVFDIVVPDEAVKSSMFCARAEKLCNKIPSVEVAKKMKVENFEFFIGPNYLISIAILTIE